MKRLQIIFILAVSCLLAACNTDEATDMSENPVDILPAADTERPEHGDVYLIETSSAEQFVYAYIEENSEVSVDDSQDNVLNIRFDEPDDSEEYVLYSIELDSDQGGETMNFFINDEEVDVEVIYSDDEELSS
ncbi:hypothetical protein [Salinicoccus roseus]|uniref:hypothetical protein n=1 Tax=Salinicoccus roseus TaxID=45670 RepID=UPI0023009153|nr:hypothetical protein [Salinicoccus roseus]